MNEQKTEAAFQEGALQKPRSRRFVWRCSVKKMFLKILQNLQEDTCARVAFLIKMEAESCSFI